MSAIFVAILNLCQLWLSCRIIIIVRHIYCYHEHVSAIFVAILNFYQLWPFENLGICRQDISKTIWARGLKLGQLIGDDEYITWLNFKKKSPYFFGVMTLWKFGHFKTCQQDISKSIWARGLKLDQLIGDDEYITWLNFKKKITLFFRS